MKEEPLSRDDQPTVVDWMHDLPVKKYDNGEPGKYFCHCIYCHTNFVGYKHDYKCPVCTLEQEMIGSLP